MKKMFILFAFLCTAFLLGCKKDKQDPVDSLFIAANKNNTRWVGTVSALYTPNKDSLMIFGTKESTDEHLFIQFDFKGKGTSTIKPGNSYFYKLVLGDILESGYYLDASKTNTITITSFNVATGVAQGDYNLNFIKSNGDSNVLDKLVFSGGKFWLIVPPIK